MPFEIQVRATLITELLGSQPANQKLYEEFIKSKAPEGVEDPDLNYSSDEIIEKGTTIFHRDEEGYLCVRDYQIKGHLKYVGDQLRKVYSPGKGNKSGWESWKPNANFCLHIYPRLIRLEGIKAPHRINERPLRAMTMQGERVSLARSEEVSPGAQFEFGIVCTGLLSLEQITECLDYGEHYGIGQWRNSGFGRYEYEILKKIERAPLNKHEPKIAIKADGKRVVQPKTYIPECDEE